MEPLTSPKPQSDGNQTATDSPYEEHTHTAAYKAALIVKQQIKKKLQMPQIPESLYGECGMCLQDLERDRAD